MPKKEIQDYIFYKIVCLDDSCDLCYVGCTANWKARVYKHKFNCTNETSSHYNLKVYKTIRANDGWQNFKMIQIGTREQLTFRQAEQIEEDYRAELKATMNGKRCFVTPEQQIELKNQYNHEKIACECGCMVARSALAKHKRTQKHIELVQNKDNIKANTINKVVCDCGCIVNRIHDLARHKTTTKHIKLVQNKL